MYNCLLKISYQKNIITFTGLGLLLLNLGVYFITEGLWFESLNISDTFTKRIITQVALCSITGAISLLFLLGNLAIAQRLPQSYPLQRPNRRAYITPPPSLRRKPTTNLKILLPVVLAISFLITLILIHYLQTAFTVWQTGAPLAPLRFARWYFAPVALLILVLLLKVETSIQAISVIISVCFALILGSNWMVVLPGFQHRDFGSLDPLFNKDIGFYVFNLPFWRLLNFWLGEMFLFALLASTLIYLLSDNSLSEGKFTGFLPSQVRHLFALSSLTVMSRAFHHWLARYELLYSTGSVNYGAGYADVKVQLPGQTILTFLAGAIALFLLLGAFKHRGSKWLLGSMLIYCIALLLNSGLTFAVQRLEVQPNELAREESYIKQTIAYTRSAFALDKIEEETFNPEGTLTAADIDQNFLTIENIRIWDTRPLLEANRQLQQIRLYYKFPDADIDRYTLQVERSPQKRTTEKQQVIIAAREMDSLSLPEKAQTWVNQHLVYTHGYGFTLSPVNRSGPGGLPDYFVKNIGSGREMGESGSLLTSSKSIEYSIPIGKPRIYYGEITNTYVMTDTQVQELDFPDEEGNAYNTYNGTGGIPIDNTLRRLLFAVRLKDWRMPFSRNLTGNTRLLWRRNINTRVRTIAPFLRFDEDPYLVVADAGKGGENYLYWMIDAYTTSASYPYSDPGANQFNYIRNSVKVVVDAYNGKVNFYISDPEDPIIRTWSHIFPELFQPLENMPATLRSHIRYPEDLFNIQSKQLLTYHMSDPQVFYNREDQWEIPQEIYGSQSTALAPYYLIMRLPAQTSEEFILLHPYTPIRRPNLIAWLAARSDGEQYGKLLLYRFSKQKLVYGPDQIEALINQDPVISQQISLWDREGSRVVQGNLLVIPIEQSLLYVEPLYLEAEENSVPILARVIVVYQNRIVMAETLPEAIQVMFKPEAEFAPTIIRSLDELLEQLPAPTEVDTQ